MFESLGDRLAEIFSKLKGHGKITEKDVEAAMREIRIALLDADVNYKVVKMFVERVRSRAVGEEVIKSVTPAQQVIKIVDEEMIDILGGGNQALNFSSSPPSNLMLVGLQGSGKTTAAAKLALFLQKQGRNPMLVAADIYRPAAIDQLVALGEKINIPVARYKNKSAVEIVMESQKEASKAGVDVLVLDTAGRLHIDEAMMQELVDIKDKVHPSEILLVVDA
ncbi:MAG: signal recognition particle receptor subunit alpha, partial [Actinomycetota bacterium]|nr:signal recognition particle receptor subunit alpha [Actinomycetota bacterium]